MPTQTTKNSVLARLGAKLNGAIAKAIETPIDWGQQGPPPGITNGVAQLIECKFSEYKSGPNKGQPYFRMAGVIIEPFSVIVDGREVPAAGSQTSMMIPICDTKSSTGEVTPTGDHIIDVVNEMKKIATEEYIAQANLVTVADLERVAEEIAAAKPYFRFSTSRRASREYIDPVTKQKKQSKEGVWENWYGSKGLENYSPPEDTESRIQDQTSSRISDDQWEDPSNADGAMDGVAPNQKPSENIDISALVEAAKRKDGTAQDALNSMAIQAGATKEQIEEAQTWEEVAAIIAGPQSNGELSDDVTTEGEAEPESKPEPEPWKLEKGSVVKWHPWVTDPKNKGKLIRSSKQIECEVVMVNKDGSKVNLKNGTTGKVEMDATSKPPKARWVPVSELEPV